LIANTDTLFDKFALLDRNEKKIIKSLHTNEMAKPGTPELVVIWETNW
jgi:hypothetical protein